MIGRRGFLGGLLALVAAPLALLAATSASGLLRTGGKVSDLAPTCRACGKRWKAMRFRICWDCAGPQTRSSWHDRDLWLEVAKVIR